MRYESYQEFDTKKVNISVNTYFDREFAYTGAKIDVTDKEFKLSTRHDVMLVSISDEGVITMDIRESAQNSYLIENFFREFLGKRMHINWRRHNYTVLIYNESERWRTAVRYRRTDLAKSLATFDLRLNPLSGLRKLPLPPQRDEYGNIIKKTTSQW
jgi:hypothetical protein